MARVEFYYDLVSPYSYLARGELARICDEQGAELELRPMLLGAVHNAAGVQAPIYIKSKARYQATDIRRWAGHYGLPLDFPNPFNGNVQNCLTQAKTPGIQGIHIYENCHSNSFNV